MELPQQLVDLFQARQDSQITGLEIFSIALGICTFKHLLVGAAVEIGQLRRATRHC